MGRKSRAAELGIVKAGGGTLVASVEPTVQVKQLLKIRLGVNPAVPRRDDRSGNLTTACDS